jgi:hypothetical protein
VLSLRTVCVWAVPAAVDDVPLQPQVDVMRLCAWRDDDDDRDDEDTDDDDDDDDDDGSGDDVGADGDSSVTTTKTTTKTTKTSSSVRPGRFVVCLQAAMFHNATQSLFVDRYVTTYTVFTRAQVHVHPNTFPTRRSRYS